MLAAGSGPLLLRSGDSNQRSIIGVDMAGDAALLVGVDGVLC